MTMQRCDELSPEELDRIERRVAAATVGPWLPYIAGRDSEADFNFIELGSCNEVGTFKSIELIGATAADHDFIAGARQDLPKLLQEVRRLRACLQSQRSTPADFESQTRRSIADGPAPRLSSSM